MTTFYAYPEVEGRPTAVGGWTESPARDELHAHHLYVGRVGLESDFLLESDVKMIPPLLARLGEEAARLGLFDAGTADRVAMALNEALLNGIQHGNLELDSRLRQADEAAFERLAASRRRRPPYRDRRLHVRAVLSRRGAVYVIRDEGPGFDPSALPDPADPAHLETTTGRGLLLIRAFMDQVAFNRAGNELTLVKRRTTPAPPGHPGLVVDEPDIGIGCQTII